MPPSNFLKDLVFLTKGTEVPEIFALWCGVSAIDSALGRKCWIDMEEYTLYPNLFVILVAGSGRCRKSTAIGMVEKMLYRLDPPLNIVAQKITTEALISTLRTKAGCEGHAIVDELSNFLNRKSYESNLAQLLINLYDCKSKYVNETKSRGKEILTNCYLSLLAASTLEWIRSAIPADAIGGGLTSRMIFVYVDKPCPPIARIQHTQARTDARARAMFRLQQIAMLAGEFTLAKDAWTLFESIYHNFCSTTSFFENKNLSGYASRRDGHLLKIAMALCVSGEDNMEIQARHVKGADAILQRLELNLPKVLHLISASDEGNLLEDVFTRVEKTGSRGITKAELTRRMSYRLNAFALDGYIQTLRQSKRIRHDYNGDITKYFALEHEPDQTPSPPLGGHLSDTATSVSEALGGSQEPSDSPS